MSRNENAKGSTNFEYSFNPGLNKKLMPLHKRSFRHQSTHTEEKLKLEAVNYNHKTFHLGCCSSPRSASVITLSEL